MADSPLKGWGVRHGQVILQFFMCLILSSLNSLLPICIIAMTTPGTSPNHKVSTFPDWDNQSFILMSSYVGYGVAQLFGGNLARKYGFKWFMIVGTILVSLLSIAIPSVCLLFGSSGLILSLLVQGTLLGGIKPMSVDFISEWIPVDERTFLGTIILGATHGGTIFSTIIAGLLVVTQWGWPSAFYLFGAIGICWSFLMLIWGSSGPEQHPHISEEERRYITTGQNRNRKKNVPWCCIFKSGPFWAALLSEAGTGWAARLGSTEFPTYLSKCLHFNVALAGTFLSIVYLISCLWTYPASYTFAHLINKNIVTVESCRKICSSICCWVPAVVFILLTFLDELPTNFAFPLIMVMFLGTTTSCFGPLLNYNDLSPNFSGVISGVAGCVSSFASLVPLIITQKVVTDQTNSSQWNHVFLLSAFFAGLANVFYLIEGSADVQYWDTNEENQGSTLSDERTPSLVQIGFLKL